MKKLLSYVFLLALIGVSGYFIYEKNLRPCDQPLEYSIGIFDSQFGISEEDFKSYITEAGSVWEKALDRKIFIYNPSASFKINLIYDERQLATIQKQKTEFGLSAVEDAFKKLDADFSAFKSQYDQKVAVYEQNLALYRAGKYSNAEIGQLNVQADELNNMTKQLNALLSERNAKAVEYNKIAQDYNKQYNGGLEFNQAEYVNDSGGKRINVYQFGNQKDLILALTHELGHALGMNHVENPKSIMYYITGINAETSPIPTAEDLAELNKVCPDAR
jgi:predicted Zn-dependent protease